VERVESMTNFAQVIASRLGEDAERPAVKFDEVVLSYGALDDAAQRAAGLLATCGVKAGDRVGLQMPNLPYFPILYLGILRLGAVMVPMNPLLKQREVAYHLSDSGARVMVGWHGFKEALTGGCELAGAQAIEVVPGEFDGLLARAEPVAQITERAPGDAAVIVYTSGTTGTPKGALLTHANLLAGAQTGTELIDAKPEGVSLAALPLFHIFGLNSIMNTAFYSRGLMTLVARFEPEKVLEVMERDRVTTFGGVPTMYMALLHDPAREQHDVSSLDICVSGGAPMPVEVLHGFDEAFGTKVLEGFGLSETTGMGSFNLPSRERKPGSIGLPVGGTEIRILDDDGNEVPQGERGEIVMRGPFVMSGCWGRDEATAEAIRAGWFYTGDIGSADEDGYLYVVDRKKDLILRGGYNVYPRELEEVIYAHPDVLEAAVVGVPDASLGEEVGAAISLRPGSTETAASLQEYVKERVAAYKYPRWVWFVDELPKGPTGKILKRQIERPVGRTQQSDPV
jgi:long-chain acyl-CoA synthetase